MQSNRVVAHGKRADSERRVSQGQATDADTMSH